MGYTPPNGLGSLLGSVFDPRSITEKTNKLAKEAIRLDPSAASDILTLRAQTAETESWWDEAMRKAGGMAARSLRYTPIIGPAIAQAQGIVAATKFTPEESLASAEKRFADRTTALNEAILKAVEVVGPQAVLKELEAAGISLDPGIAKTRDSLLTMEDKRDELADLDAEIAELRDNPPPDMMGAARTSRLMDLNARRETLLAGKKAGAPAETSVLKDYLDDYKFAKGAVEGTEPRPQYPWDVAAAMEFINTAKDMPLALVKDADFIVANWFAMHRTIQRGVPFDAGALGTPLTPYIEGFEAALEVMLPRDEGRARDFSTQLMGAFGSMAGFFAVRAAGVPVAVAGAAVQGIAGVEDARAHDAKAGQVLLAWLLNSALGTTEAIPIERMLRRAGPTDQLLNRIARDKGYDWMSRMILDSKASGIEEFLQELGQALGEDGIAKYGLGGILGEWSGGYDPERHTSLAEYAERGAIGFLSGAGTSLGVDAAVEAAFRASGGENLSAEEQRRIVDEILSVGAQTIDQLFNEAVGENYWADDESQPIVASQGYSSALFTGGQAEGPAVPLPATDEDFVDPGTLSAQIAPVIEADVRRYTETGEVFEPLVVSPETASGNLRSQQSVEAIYRGEKPAGKRWTPQARVVLTAPGTDLPPVAIGDITFDDWIAKVEGIASAEDIQKWAVWYQTSRDTVAQRLNVSTEMAARIVHAWLEANQQNSPSGSFLEAVTQTEEIAKGEADTVSRSAGLRNVALAVRKILRGEAIDSQFSVKISDFFDSSDGKETRRWVGDDPAGGAPFVIDRHSARDLGVVSAVYLDMLAARGYQIPDGIRDDVGQSQGKKGRLTENSITDTIYNNRAAFGRDLTAHLNEIGWQGRSDWKSYEVQAVGWMATLRLTGQKAEDMSLAIDTNESDVAFMVSPVTTTAYGAEISARFAALPAAAQRQIAGRIAGMARRAAFSRSRAMSSTPIIAADGGWENLVSPAAVTHVVATKEGVRETALMLGLLLDQQEVFAPRVTPYTPSAKSLSIDIVFPVGTPRDATVQAYEALRAAGVTDKNKKNVVTGFMPMVFPDGREGIRIIAGSTTAQASKLHAYLTEGAFADAMGPRFGSAVDIRIMQADVVSVSNDWTQGTKGYEDQLSELSGRDTVAGLLLDRAAIHDAFRTEIERAERALADGAVDGRGAEGGRDPRGDAGFGALVRDLGGDEGSPQAVDGPTFDAAMQAAAPGLGPAAAQVSRVLPDREGVQRFLLDDGKTGFALEGDNIIGVFSTPGVAPGAAQRVLRAAVAMGGRRLDGFNTFLPGIYAKGGFRAVAKLGFDPAYAPKAADGALADWDADGMRTARRSPVGAEDWGAPEVVFMVYDPANASAETDNVVPDYDAGVAAQDAALAELGSLYAQTARVAPGANEEGQLSLGFIGDPTSDKFGRFFKASYVVDENGDALEVYHGTGRSGFTEFDEGEQGDPGFWFSNLVSVSATYPRSHRIERDPDVAKVLGTGLPFKTGSSLKHPNGVRTRVLHLRDLSDEAFEKLVEEVHEYAYQFETDDGDAQEELLRLQREESIENEGEEWFVLQINDTDGGGGAWETMGWPIDGNRLAATRKEADGYIGREFALKRGQGASMGGAIYPVYLSLQNPMIVDYEGKWWNEGPSSGMRHRVAYNFGSFSHSGFANASEVYKAAKKARNFKEITHPILSRIRATDFVFSTAEDAAAFAEAILEAREADLKTVENRLRDLASSAEGPVLSAARGEADTFAEAMKQVLEGKGQPLPDDFDERAERLRQKKEAEARENLGKIDFYKLARFLRTDTPTQSKLYEGLPDPRTFVLGLFSEVGEIVGREDDGSLTELTIEEAFDYYVRRWGLPVATQRFVYAALENDPRGAVLDVSNYSMLVVNGGKSIDPRFTSPMSVAVHADYQAAPENYLIAREGGPRKTRDFVQLALEDGSYDGVIFRNIMDTADGSAQEGDVYVAFYPEQIKSSVSNNGEYDPTNPDIYAAVARPKGTGTSGMRDPYLGEQTRPEAGTPLAQASATGKPVGLSEIGQMFAKVMNLVPAQARFILRNKNVMGQFDARTGAIRLRSMKDISTLFHEAGHNLFTMQNGALSPMIRAHKTEILKAAVGADKLYEGDLTNEVEARKLNEGFAELFRVFVGNRDFARQYAPGFTKALEDFLQQRAPKMLEGLDVIGGMVGAWQSQSSLDAVKSGIVSGKPDRWMQTAIEELHDKGFPATMHRYLMEMTKHTVDRAIPLRELVSRLMRQSAQNGVLIDLTTAYDPGKRFDLVQNSGAIAMENFYHGVIGYRSTSTMSPALQDALFLSQGVAPDVKTIRNFNTERHEDFGALLVSLRAIALHKLGKLDRLPTEHGIGDHEQTLRDLETKYGQKVFADFMQAAKMVNDYGRALWQKRYDAGLLSKDVYEAGLKADFYVPLYRDMSDRNDNVGAAFKQAASGTKMPLMHRLRGSDRSIIDPLVGLMTQTFAVEAAIAQNEVKVVLAELIDKVKGSGSIAQRVPSHDLSSTKITLRDIVQKISGIESMDETDAADMAVLMQPYMEQEAFIRLYAMQATHGKGDALTFFWEGGELKALQILDKEIASDVVNLLDVVGPDVLHDVFMTTLMVAQTTVRQAITRWPDFIMRNFFRGELQAWASTDIGYIPLWDGVKGGINIVADRMASRLYNSAGGLFGGVSTAQLEGAKYNRDVLALRGRGFVTKLFARGKVSGLAHLTEISESATRIGIMDKAYQRAIRDGLTEYEAMMEAAHMATDFQNFGAHGQTTHVIRKIVPFLNAQLISLHKMERVIFASETARRVGRTDALKYLIQSFVKDVNGMPLTRAEKRDIAIARKAWIAMCALGAVSAVIHAAFWDDEDYQNRGEYLAATHWWIPYGDGKAISIPKPFEWALIANIVERSLEAASGDEMAMQRLRRSVFRTAVPAVDNPLLTAIAEHRANYSFFRDAPLISQWDKADFDYRPEDAYTAYTSQLAKDIAKITPWGDKPYLIDHYWNALLATAGRDIASIYELVRNPNAAALTVYDTPILRSAVRSTTRGTVATQDFWNLMGATNGRYVGAAGVYGNYLSAGNPAATADLLRGMPENDRTFAILQKHFEAEHKRLHPLRRAQDVSTVASALRREIRNGPGPLDTSGSGSLFIALTPRQRALLTAELTSLAMREQRNAMIMLGEPGWGDKQTTPTDDTLAVIRALSPEFADELERRFEKSKIYPFEAVQELWPEAENRIRLDGENAYLDDLSGTAKWW